MLARASDLQTQPPEPVLAPRRGWSGTAFRLAVAILLVVVILVVEILAFSRPPTVFHGRARAPRISSRGEPLDSATFAAGACMAFGPTTGNRHETVFLDAGHDGIDPGGVGTTQSGQTIYEADATLPVELDAMGILRAQGFRVVVSRTGDSMVVRLGSADVSGGVLTLQGAHDDVAARDIAPMTPGRASWSASISTPVVPSREPGASPPTTLTGRSRPRTSSWRT